jgi:hypothetical protein
MGNTTTLRRIQPIIMPIRADKVIIPPPPKLEMIFLHQLLINDQYQRKLSTASMTLIRNIARDFKWTSYHPPIITACENTDPTYTFQTYELLDGQHTAIGALTNGSIKQIPCLIVDTNDLGDKAKSFVDLNVNKIRVTPIDIFWADVTRGDENAMEVYHGATSAGGKILKRAPPYGIFEEGEIKAVTVLRKIASKGGRSWVKRVVETGVKAQLAPIGAEWMRAFCLLLLDGGEHIKLPGDYKTTQDQIVLTIRKYGEEELMRTALIRRGRDSNALFRDLAMVIKERLVIES